VAPAAGQDAAGRPRRGRIISDEEIKAQIAKKHPYAKWLKKTQLVLEDLPALQPRKPATNISLLDRQQCFGYTQEDLQLLLEPMATTGAGSRRLDGHRHTDLGALRQVEVS